MRRDDNDLCLKFVRLKFISDEFHQQGEQLVVLQRLNNWTVLPLCLIRDISIFQDLVSLVKERPHQNKNMRLVSLDLVHQVSQRIKRETIASCERSRRHEHLKSFAFLHRVISLERGVVKELLVVSLRLVDPVDVEPTIGVIEAFADNHLAFEKVVVPRLTEV